MNILKKWYALFKKWRRTVETGVTCPRRMKELGPWEHEKNLDAWEMRGQSRACNFCGCLHPEDFVKFCEDVDGLNKFLAPSDKNYKVYLHGGDSESPCKFYYHHFYNLPPDKQGEYGPIIEAALRASYNKRSERLKAYKKSIPYLNSEEE